MQVTPYKKAIAVFGDTKPWKENLKQLGGKYNRNLEGGPGWIFQKRTEVSVTDFVNQANAKIIQPILETAQTLTAVAPIQATQLMPQIIPAPVPQPEVPLPHVPPLAPKHVFPPVPTIVHFPNQFTAADNLTYQIVLYTVPLPYEGQKVDLINGNGTEHYQVSEIYKLDGVVDGIMLEYMDKTQEKDLLEAAIISGEWRLLYNEEPIRELKFLA